MDRGSECNVAQAASAWAKAVMVAGWQMEHGSHRHMVTTPVLPEPQEGAADCPARIIESGEPLDAGIPFI